MRWLDSITNSADMNLSKLGKIVEDRGAWHAAVYGSQSHYVHNLATDHHLTDSLKIHKIVNNENCIFSIRINLHFPPSTSSPKLYLPLLSFSEMGSYCPMGNDSNDRNPWSLALIKGQFSVSRRNTGPGRRLVPSYLLCGAGDNALLEAIGLLLKVFSSLVIPEQIVFYLEIKHRFLSRRHVNSPESKVISETASS